MNVETRLGATALMVAAESGRTEAMEVLERSVGVDATGAVLGVAESHTDTAQVLLKAGADVDAKNVLGETALHRAASNGHTETVEILLKAGADVNVEDDKSYTPLMGAAAANQTETVRALLKEGADVNARDKDGDTALAYTDDDELVELLKKAGAKE